MPTPWMKFSLDDFCDDLALRPCSLAAQGAWLHMLRAARRGDEYGVLRSNGRPLSVEAIACIIGKPIEEIEPLVTELRTAGVFDLSEDGAIVSRRMVRDAEQAKIDRENGEKGGNPALTRGLQGWVNRGAARPVNPEKRREEKRREDKHSRARDPGTTDSEQSTTRKQRWTPTPEQVERCKALSAGLLRHQGIRRDIAPNQRTCGYLDCAAENGRSQTEACSLLEAYPSLDDPRLREAGWPPALFPHRLTALLARENGSRGGSGMSADEERQLAECLARLPPEEGA